MLVDGPRRSLVCSSRSFWRNKISGGDSIRFYTRLTVVFTGHMLYNRACERKKGGL